jgi:hypothetical protein
MTNYAAISETEIRAYGLNRVLRASATTEPPTPACFVGRRLHRSPSFSGDLSPTVASSANEQMVLGVGVSPEQGG